MFKYRDNKQYISPDMEVTDVFYLKLMFVMSAVRHRVTTTTRDETKKNMDV